MAGPKTAAAKAKEINWIGWGLGIGATVSSVGLLWLVQFFAFGFEEYVKNIVETVQIPQETINTLEIRLAGIEKTMVAEALANEEFRKEQRADMRNLVQIISRRGS